MCNHYGITVDPADPACPTHKPNVERAIGIIQRDFYPRIRKKRFSTLIDLNKELNKWLQGINHRPIRGRGQSRSFFLDKERPLLSPLSPHPYELFYFKKATVHPDCHFQHEKNYYSVPHRYVGGEINIKFNSKMVRAYFQCEKIASHSSCKGTYHYSTNSLHYPEKKYVDTSYHLEQIKLKSQQIGPHVYDLVEGLIRQAKHPLKVLRKVQGIIRLGEKFSKEALDYACKMAIDFERTNYDNIKRFAGHYRKPKEDILKKTPTREEQYTYYQQSGGP